MAENGSRVLVVSELLSVNNGKLDLKDNDMIVRTGALGSFNGTSYTGITGLIASGRNAGSWDGAGSLGAGDYAKS